MARWINEQMWCSPHALICAVMLEIGPSAETLNMKGLLVLKTESEGALLTVIK